LLTVGGLEFLNQKDNQAWGPPFATNFAAAFFALSNKFSMGVKARAIYLVAVPFSPFSGSRIGLGTHQASSGAANLVSPLIEISSLVVYSQCGSQISKACSRVE
jgi:hypothetical protein